MRQIITKGLASIYTDVPTLRPGTVGAYALAFVSVGVATALQVAIDPYVVGVSFITFFPSVIITTLISGFGAGVFCVVLSTAAASFFLLPPRLSFWIKNPADVMDLLLFIVEAFFYVILIVGMRLTIERYRELNQKLELQGTALRESEARLPVVVAELQHRTRNFISVASPRAQRSLVISLPAPSSGRFRCRGWRRLPVRRGRSVPGLAGPATIGRSRHCSARPEAQASSMQF